MPVPGLLHRRREEPEVGGEAVGVRHRRHDAEAAAVRDAVAVERVVVADVGGDACVPGRNQHRDCRRCPDGTSTK